MLSVTIPEFFTGKNIFITGGSGFIGKVLIEKLLRSCPDIGNIYLLMRPKKGLNAEERIRKIVDLPLFDRLKNEQSLEIFKKIKIVLGDMAELGLGLIDEDRALLIKNINVIFHAAASVRFDDSLKNAILMNTRGTREVAYLALEMPNLFTFMYVSTAYSQCDKNRIEEITYPPLADWQKSIEIAEQIDEHLIDILTLKYIHPMPNTYTFSKNLAEACINDLCQNKIPTIIYRPTIVISTAFEPMPGWIDNFNGPVEQWLIELIHILYQFCLLRNAYMNPDAIQNLIPADIIVRSMIVTTWHKCTSANLINDLTVYNGGSNCKNFQLTAKEPGDLGFRYVEDVPFDDVLWYPKTDVYTSSSYYYLARVILFQLIPALMIDALLSLTGKKPMVFKLQQKIYGANMAVGTFLTKQWFIVNDNLMISETKLIRSDFEQFGYGFEQLDKKTYCFNAVFGARRYLLKENDDKIESAQKHLHRMWRIMMLWNFVWYVTIVWLLFIKFNVLSIIVGRNWFGGIFNQNISI